MLIDLGGVLGLLQDHPEHFLQRGAASTEGLSDGDIEALIERRNQARGDKDWAAADGIRDELHNAGVVLEDSAQGTSWRRQAVGTD